MPSFVAILSSLTAAKLPEGTGWQLNGLPCSTGQPVTVQLLSEYVDVGSDARLPGRLVALVRGDAMDMIFALGAFGQVLNFLAPIISVAANVYIPEFKYDLAYENSAHSGEHPFRQWFRQEPDPLLKPKRQDIDPNLGQELLHRILQHSEGARVHRACVQYQEALDSWQLGGELRSVMHLWMAVEALTKAMLRVECQKQAVDDDGLCSTWGIAKDSLDSEVRRRLIFHNDTACYDMTRRTSDGLEHMFEDFPKLHGRAQQCRDCAGFHVRLAMLELLDFDDADKQKLLAPPYAVPVPLEVLDRSIYGDLIGPGERLARPGFGHPQLINWRPEIVSVTKKGDGHEVAIADNFQWALGPDVQFKAKAVGTNIQLNSVEMTVTRAADASGTAADSAGSTDAPQL